MKQEIARFCMDIQTRLDRLAAHGISGTGLAKIQGELTEIVGRTYAISDVVRLSTMELATVCAEIYECLDELAASGAPACVQLVEGRRYIQLCGDAKKPRRGVIDPSLTMTSVSVH